MTGRVSRRTLILSGASGLLLAGAGLAVAERVGRNEVPAGLGASATGVVVGPTGVPSMAPGPMVSGSFVSAKRIGITCGWSVSYPPGSTPSEKLPVVLALHGRDATHSDMFGSQLALDRFLALHVSAGHAAFAIAAVDAGNSFYHHRATGEDSGAMIIDEFMPLLAARGLDLSRLALLGFSMGGYGALRIGGALGSSNVKAIAVESMAIWKNPADVPQGLFDSAADYAANTVWGRQAELKDIPLRIDCGLQDALYPEVKAYQQSFSPKPPGVFAPGVHDYAFWRSVAPAQLNFLAKYLA